MERRKEWLWIGDSISVAFPAGALVFSAMMRAGWLPSQTPALPGEAEPIRSGSGP